MDNDDLWRTIDEQRADLADVFETLTPEEWATPSLCSGWTVRDVAAHLTMAQMGLPQAFVEAVRAGGSFDRMIRVSAVRRAAAMPETEFGPLLRAMAGSRRTAPMVSDTEPLTDVLVHGQDLSRPLGRRREMPTEAAATSTQRVWSTGFPFFARKRMKGFRLVATDHDWQAGEGEVVEAPIGDLLLLVTGRHVVLPDLTGPGADALRARLG